MFGGSTLVTTDAAVAAGYSNLGDKDLVTSVISTDFANRTMALIREKVEEAVDSVKVCWVVGWNNV